MFIFYSERVKGSVILVKKMQKEWRSIVPISIEQHQDLVRQKGIKKIPTVIRGDGTRLEGEECKTLFKKKPNVLGFSGTNNNAPVNAHQRISTPQGQESLSTDYNYFVIPTKGLLGQEITNLNDNSLSERMVMGSSGGMKDLSGMGDAKTSEREMLDRELGIDRL